MATFQTPARQPFGLLDTTKLRNLQSIKNRQNAVTQASAQSLKRGRVSPDVSDSENVDPNRQLFKRKRMGNDDDLIKSSPVSLKPALKSILKPRSRISTSSLPIPKTPTQSTPVQTISSAPSAVNRSPTKSKRPGILSTHRTRLNAPSLNSRPRSNLSLSAALQGTLRHKKPLKAQKPLTSSKPNSWFFDIYEDAPEEESSSFQLWHTIGTTDALDISDSEAAADRATPSTPYDEAETNKENIAPDSGFLPAHVTRAPAISRKDMMSDDARSPLTDLKPADYYGEGCDATSVTLVQDDDAPVPEPVVEKQQLEQIQPAPSCEAFDFHAPLPLDTAPSCTEVSPLATQSLSSLLQSVAPVLTATALPPAKELAVPDPEEGLFSIVAGEGVGAEPAAIEIWESESAKDESEVVDA